MKHKLEWNKGQKDIRMIALDLDGTTLNKKMEITERTVWALEEAGRRGIHVVVATGRTYHTLPKQLYEIEGLRYVVTSNGAVINELKTGDVIYRNCLPRQAVERTAEILREGGADCIFAGDSGVGNVSSESSPVSIEIFTDGHAYLEKAELEEIQRNGSPYRNTVYVATTRKPVEGILSFLLAYKEKIENICLNFPDVSQRPMWRERLSVLEGVTLTTSLPYNLEIGGTSTSKAEALRFLMKRLGIRREQLMACGDSQNDASMIELAGLGVVMGNSSEEMKRLADFVTDSNEEEGVAKAVQRFVL